MFNIAVDVSAMASPDGNKVCECKKRYVQDPVAKHTQSKEEDEDITDLSGKLIDLISLMCHSQCL